MEFIPYKANEILEHKYYQIPQELFVNPKYKDNLNSDSKILYAFLLDRLSLSNKYHWFDSNNNIYLIFTRQEVQTKLNLSEKTAIKAFKQLSQVNLILEKRQGLGKPNLIYVGKIQHEEINNTEQENMQIQNCKNYSSEIVNNSVPNMENLQTINTNNIKTNIINTKSNNYTRSNQLKEKYISQKNKCFVSASTNDRKYEDGSLDFLYANFSYENAVATP